MGIHDELAAEIRVRLNQWKQERDALSRAAQRITELDTMIRDGETELVNMEARISQKERK